MRLLPVPAGRHPDLSGRSGTRRQRRRLGSASGNARRSGSRVRCRTCYSDAAVVAREFETLRLAINRMLFVGLFEYEGRFTVYSQRAFFHRHRNRFCDAPQRVVSCILYLNENWNESGADGVYQDVVPQSGTLVTFLSVSAAGSGYETAGASFHDTTLSWSRDLHHPFDFLVYRIDSTSHRASKFAAASPRCRPVPV